jgi:hypothetical protein
MVAVAVATATAVEKEPSKQILENIFWKECLGIQQKCCCRFMGLKGRGRMRSHLNNTGIKIAVSWMHMSPRKTSRRTHHGSQEPKRKSSLSSLVIKKYARPLREGELKKLE